MRDVIKARWWTLIKGMGIMPKAILLLSKDLGCPVAGEMPFDMRIEIEDINLLSLFIGSPQDRYKMSQVVPH
jgi:hypothetical protein